MHWEVPPGNVGTSFVFIKPGSYTLSGGTNLTLVDPLNEDEVNKCQIDWYETSARLYVVDHWSI